MRWIVLPLFFALNAISAKLEINGGPKGVNVTLHTIGIGAKDPKNININKNQTVTHDAFLAGFNKIEWITAEGRRCSANVEIKGTDSFLKEVIFIDDYKKMKISSKETGVSGIFLGPYSKLVKADPMIFDCR